MTNIGAMRENINLKTILWINHNIDNPSIKKDLKYWLLDLTDLHDSDIEKIVRNVIKN